MAESGGQERTEQATPKRREDARRKGQVPRSRELNTTLMLLAASGMVLMFGGHFVAVLADILRNSFGVSRAQLARPEAMVEALSSLTMDALLALLPFFVVMALVAILASTLVSGWTFSSEQIGLKWNRLDPMKGLGRIFAWRGMLELVKALLKFALVLAVAIALLWSDIDDLMAMGGEPVAVAAMHAADLAAWGFLILSFALVLLPLIDVPFQLWDHTRQLRMTRQEIRDEMKQSDGSPEVKARLRQLQRDLSRRRMMEAIPRADVIVTNPTHYAVALRYDQGKSRAPVVVAKGMDLIALQIRNVANEHHVPIVEAPPLARALYHSTKLDQEIPAGLYLAVAKLLAYVYQLRHMQPGKNGAAVAQPDFPVPDEFVRS